MPTRAPRTEPRRRPRQARSRFTVDAILEAATYVLSERGFDAMTTNEVARRAGVNIASLYQYFPSKDALLAEVARRHALRMRAGALEVLQSGSRKTRGALLRELVHRLVEEHRHDPALHSTLVEQSARLQLGPLRTEVDGALSRERGRHVDDLPGADLPTWIATTAAHAVVHAAVSERREALTSGALEIELTRLVEAYLLPARKRARPKKTR